MSHTMKPFMAPFKKRVLQAKKNYDIYIFKKQISNDKNISCRNAC